MRTALHTLTLCLAASALTPAAQAADLAMQPQPVQIEPAPVIVGGWYLRGDIGVSVDRSAQWHESEIDTPPVTTDRFNDWTGKSTSAHGILGVGVGYQFNDWFRMDVTGEYRLPTTVKGRQLIINAASQPFSADDTGKIDSWVLLANLYADIGHYGDLTPYVGVGIGGAYNRFFDAGQVSGLNAVGSYGTYQDGAHWSLATAVHAGLNYNITPQLSVDLSYRWLWLGDASTGTKTCYNGGGQTSCNVTNERWWLNGLQSQDIRIGMRYRFYEDAPAPMPVVARN